MKSKFLPLFLLTVSLPVFQACNPDCETVRNTNVIMEPKAILPGSEVLLRANPPEFLLDRNIFIDDPAGGGTPKQIEAPRFEELLQGFVLKLPEEASANTRVYMEDPDCGGLIPIDEPLQIKDEDFFYFSDQFIVPPTPFIFIPVPAVAPPAAITNAWITPYRRSYCIWFVPQMEMLPNGTLVEKKELRPRKEDDLQNGFPLFGSHEFVVCGSIGEPERHLNANVNPVSGYVDKENNDIMIRIDRTSKGLGSEVFTGRFIDIGDQIPDTPDWRFGGSCAARNREAGDFMLLTSQTTGQQLLMIKANP